MEQQIDPKVLAALLRKPEGENGIMVAEKLNETNVHITNFTYDCVAPREGQTILEIGFGNGKLMPALFDKAKNFKLVGIELSEDMINVGNTFLISWIRNGLIELLPASVENMPFEDNTFDAVCTINTLYFWPDPINDAKEVLRVLKPGGKVFIAIRPKKVAEKLPATQYGFQLYENDEAMELLRNASFKNVHIESQLDRPVEFNGEMQSFESWVVIGSKPE